MCARTLRGNSSFFIHQLLLISTNRRKSQELRNSNIPVKGIQFSQPSHFHNAANFDKSRKDLSKKSVLRSITQRQHEDRDQWLLSFLISIRWSHSGRYSHKRGAKWPPDALAFSIFVCASQTVQTPASVSCSRRAHDGRTENARCLINGCQTKTRPLIKENVRQKKKAGITLFLHRSSVFVIGPAVFDQIKHVRKLKAKHNLLSTCIFFAPRLHVDVDVFHSLPHQKGMFLKKNFNFQEKFSSFSASELPLSAFLSSFLPQNGICLLMSAAVLPTKSDETP